MGASTSLTTLYAWAWRGNRARTKVSRNREPNTTLLASMTHNGIGLCVAVVDSTTREVFEAYIEQVFSTALKPGRCEQGPMGEAAGSDEAPPGIAMEEGQGTEKRNALILKSLIGNLPYSL